MLDLWWMERVALGLDFLRKFQCFHADYYYTNAPFSHLLSRACMRDLFAAIVLKNSCLTPSQDYKNKPFKGQR
jgi:hypothetical protein